MLSANPVVTAETLLNWYDRNGRDLPWRVKGARQDPYLVWLSEIMLQQTTVAAVRDYFRTFTSRWPNVATLAAAPRDDVLKAWAGLGYYARARNLHACAQVVAHELQGKFPATPEALQTLPGIGPYTSAAIAAIAFDQPVAAIDGNVERVISRLHAIETPLPQSKPEIRQHAQAMVPQERAGDFAQAMMDLGATVCTPKSPNCAACPFHAECKGRQLGIAATLPRKIPKGRISTRQAYAYVVTVDDSILLRTRPDNGLLGGMTEIPTSEWLAKLPKNFAAMAPVKAKWKKVPGIVGHTFTHFHFEVTVLRAAIACLPPGTAGRLVPVKQLREEALPSVMRKIAAHALG